MGEKLDSIGVKSDSSKYSPEVNAIFPGKAYLQRFIDPKTDLTGTQPSILKKYHSFYENHIACNGKRSMSLLEVGGGPCIYSLITAAKYVDSITFSDYAETNRKEINLWKEERPERHDWSKYVEYVVRDLEGDYSEDAVERREKLLRGKINKIISCNVRKDSFFDGEYETRQYDVVQSSGCFEAALDSQEAYRKGVVKLSSYVKPGGYLQLRTATGATWYTCPGLTYNMFVLNVEPEDNLKGIEMAGMRVLETVDIQRADDAPYSSTKSYQLTLAQKQEL